MPEAGWVAKMNAEVLRWAEEWPAERERLFSSGKGMRMLSDLPIEQQHAARRLEAALKGSPGLGAELAVGNDRDILFELYVQWSAVDELTEWATARATEKEKEAEAASEETETMKAEEWEATFLNHTGSKAEQLRELEWLSCWASREALKRGYWLVREAFLTVPGVFAVDSMTAGERMCFTVHCEEPDVLNAKLGESHAWLTEVGREILFIEACQDGARWCTLLAKRVLGIEQEKPGLKAKSAAGKVLPGGGRIWPTTRMYWRATKGEP